MQCLAETQNRSHCGRRHCPTEGDDVSNRRSTEPGAYAVVRGEESRVFLAEDASVISRLLGLELVATTPPESIGDPVLLGEIRNALLQERWGDALVAWMKATGEVVDVYEGYVPVWTEDELDETRASLEVRMSPIFGLSEGVISR